MAVLGFDLAPLRSAITELGQGLRNGAQQAGQAIGQAAGGNDYLGFLGHLAPTPASPRPALPTGPLMAPDYLGQLAFWGGQQGGLGMSPAASFTSAPSPVWDQLNAYASNLAIALRPPAPPPTATTGSTVTGGGGGWTGPATAADNATLTAQQVDDVIRKTRGNSPMIGKGQLILDYANAHNVSVPEIMGIFLAESELGTTAGPGWNIAGVGGVGNFHGYASLDDAIRGAIDNLGSQQYAGHSLEEHIGYWFVGPQKWAASGLDASDGVNGTVRDYIGGKVAPMYQAFGVPLNQAQAPQGGGAGHVPVTAAGFAFPVIGYSQPVQLHWGQEQGGADLMAAEGTPIVGMGDGVITDVSPNSLGGNTITMRLDNGLIVYMAHLRDAPLVQAGQRVAAGTPLGYVGTTGNAAGGPSHLHIGIGQDIQSGGGPTGGLGTGFNAVDWLNQILQQAGQH